MATPAAEPIIKALPPVPAQYARNSQKSGYGDYLLDILKDPLNNSF